MAVSESLRRIIVDAVCLAIVLAAYISVPSLFRHLDGGDGGHVPFRGFFCDDPSIRYPYRDSSISSTLVGAIGLLAPVLAVRSERNPVEKLSTCVDLMLIVSATSRN